MRDSRSQQKLGGQAIPIATIISKESPIVFKRKQINIRSNGPNMLVPVKRTNLSATEKSRKMKNMNRSQGNFLNVDSMEIKTDNSFVPNQSSRQVTKTLSNSKKRLRKSTSRKKHVSLKQLLESIKNKNQNSMEKIKTHREILDDMVQKQDTLKSISLNDTTANKISEKLRTISSPKKTHQEEYFTIGKSSISELKETLMNQALKMQKKVQNMPIEKHNGVRPKRIGHVSRYEMAHLVKKLSLKRYGKDKKEAMNKYNDLVSRMIKSDQAKFNVDMVHQQDLMVANHIFSDLNVFTELCMWSDKITDIQYEKYKRNLLKAEKENKSQKDLNKIEIFKHITTCDKALCTINNGSQLEDSALVSQNQNINHLLYQGICKSITRSENLIDFQMINQQLAENTWKMLGDNLGKNTTIRTLSFNICNLESSDNMLKLCEGLRNNKIIQKLDLSDNNLSDKKGMCVLNMIKFMAEQKKSDIWRHELRSNHPECRNHNIFQETENHKGKNCNFGNLLEKQEALLDFKKERISNYKGLRTLILRKNRLGENFAESLQRCLRFDDFMKVIDLSHNGMPESAMVDLICYALNENHSVLSIDFRFNTGTSKQVLYQTALALLKNIATYKQNNQYIDRDWIDFNTIVHQDIYRQVYIDLGLKKGIKTQQSPKHLRLQKSTSKLNLVKTKNLEINTNRQMGRQIPLKTTRSRRKVSEYLENVRSDHMKIHQNPENKSFMNSTIENEDQVNLELKTKRISKNKSSSSLNSPYPGIK